MMQRRAPASGGSPPPVWRRVLLARPSHRSLHRLKSSAAPAGHAIGDGADGFASPGADWPVSWVSSVTLRSASGSTAKARSMISSSLPGRRTCPGGSKTNSIVTSLRARPSGPGTTSPGRSRARPATSASKRFKDRQGVACAPTDQLFLALLQPIELIHNNDRDQDGDLGLPDVDQRTEVNLFQLVLVMDVEAGIRDNVVPVYGPPRDLALQRLDRGFEIRYPFVEFQRDQAVDHPLYRLFGARHGAGKPSQHQPVPFGQHQAVEVSIADLVAEHPGPPRWSTQRRPAGAHTRFGQPRRHHAGCRHRYRPTAGS